MKIMKFALAVAAVSLSGGALAYKAGMTRDAAAASAAKKYGQMNTNGKDEVTSAELDAFMAKSSAKRGEAHDAAKVARRLKRVDTDGNGTVSAAEIQAEELEKFDKADANRNGKIDDAEATA